MRNLAFFSVGLLLLLIQSNLYRVLGPLGEISFGESFRLGDWLHGATPNLILPLIIFLAVYEASTTRGVLLAFCFGYMLDILAAAPMFLFRLICVAIWGLARFAGVRLSAQTELTRIPLVLAFALVESGIVLMILAIFGSDYRRPLEIATTVIPRALATALVSPIIFKLAQRLHQGSSPSGAMNPAEAQVIR